MFVGFAFASTVRLSHGYVSRRLTLHCSRPTATAIATATATGIISVLSVAFWAAAGATQLVHSHSPARASHSGALM